MKITAILLFLVLMPISATTLAQYKLTVKVKDANILKVLEKIEEQTNYGIIFRAEELNLTRKYDINAVNIGIFELLTDVLDNEEVTFNVIDNTVVLYKKPVETQNKQDQSLVVKGKVSDLSGATLPGVNVYEKGNSQNGVITGVDGTYTINMTSEDGILVFSFIGFEGQEVNVAGRAKIDILLAEEMTDLDEVIVVGFGTQRKRDITGAISSIKTKDIKAGVVTNTAQLLKGRASGVHVRQNSAEPGGSISIRIRGASSISSNNEPLYIVDGYPTDLGYKINPADIESFEILKDASSAAIYGARGANGVVLITTKQGVKGAFAVDYSYNQSFKKLNNSYDLKDAQDIMQFNIQRAKDNGTYETNPPYTEQELKYTGKGTDWLEETTRMATTKEHLISIRGGEEKLRMALSAGYLEDEGILKNTSFDRFTSRINLNYKLSERVNFGSNIYFARSTKNYQHMGTRSTVDNIMYSILLSSPMSVPEGGDVFGNPGRKSQVLVQLLEPEIEHVTNNMYSTIFGEVEVLKDLVAKVQYTYGNNTSLNQEYYPKTTNTGGSVDGLAAISNYKDDRHHIDAILTLRKTIAEIHNLKLIGGTTFTEHVGSANGMRGAGFSTDAFSFNNIGAAKNIHNIWSNKWKTTNNSYFIRGEYVLNNKYIINGSFRADGASNFGDGNKWGYFPAGSVAWQIGDESWMEFVKPAFNNIKLRASYGITGNDGIGNYLSMAKFGIGNAYLGGTGVQKGIYMVNPANSDLKWEQTSQVNIGVDFAMLKNRIQVNVDYYNKLTTDLLNPISIPTSSSGFSSVMGNNGEIENKGFELFIKTNNISKPRFTWSTSLNLSRNVNEVKKLNEGEARYSRMSPQGAYNHEEYTILKEGYSLSTIYGYVFDGIIQVGEDHPTQPKSVPGDPKFKDINGDGIITSDDRTILGNGNPDLVIGLGNNFTFRDFDFSFFFDANIGNELYNVTSMVLEGANRTVNTFDRWTQKNPSNEIPRNGYQKDHGVQYGSYANSRFVEDASFLRLTNIELGYNLPVNNLGVNKYFKQCRIAVGAQNLFTLTKYTGFNPEVSTNGGSAVAQGLDYSSYPAYRIFNISAKVTF